MNERLSRLLLKKQGIGFLSLLAKDNKHQDLLQKLARQIPDDLVKLIRNNWTSIYRWKQDERLYNSKNGENRALLVFSLGNKTIAQKLIVELGYEIGRYAYKAEFDPADRKIVESYVKKNGFVESEIRRADRSF